MDQFALTPMTDWDIAPSASSQEKATTARRGSRVNRAGVSDRNAPWERAATPPVASASTRDRARWAVSRQISSSAVSSTCQGRSRPAEYFVAAPPTSAALNGPGRIRSVPSARSSVRLVTLCAPASGRPHSDSVRRPVGNLSPTPHARRTRYDRGSARDGGGYDRVHRPTGAPAPVRRNTQPPAGLRGAPERGALKSG